MDSRNGGAAFSPGGIASRILHDCGNISWRPISDDEWSLSARESIFRFLVNWAMTQDPSLLTLPKYASSSIVSFSRVGRPFTNSMLFHDEELRFFGHLALDGSSVLDTLLQYHFDILLSIYIRVIYT
jgi:hypothetical protein